MAESLNKCSCGSTTHTDKSNSDCLDRISAVSPPILQQNKRSKANTPPQILTAVTSSPNLICKSCRESGHGTKSSQLCKNYSITPTRAQTVSRLKCKSCGETGHGNKRSRTCKMNITNLITAGETTFSLICKSCGETGHGNKSSRTCKMNITNLITAVERTVSLFCKSCGEIGHGNKSSRTCKLNSSHTTPPPVDNKLILNIVCRSCDQADHKNKKSRKCPMNNINQIKAGVSCRSCKIIGHLTENSQSCGKYDRVKHCCNSCGQVSHKTNKSSKCNNYQRDSAPVLNQVTLPTVIPTMQTQRHNLELMNVKCKFCGARFWKCEQLKNSTKNNPLFGLCCKQGKIKLPPTNPPPEILRKLLTGSTSECVGFRTNIRAYNNSFSFASFGGDTSSTINDSGVYTFKIQGAVHHKVGPLTTGGEIPTFAQIYFYDTDNEIDNRNRHFRDLDKVILGDLQHMLHESSSFYREFKTMLQKQKETPMVEQTVVFRADKGYDPRRFNAPTASEIAVILPGDGTVIGGKRDIQIYAKSGGVRRITEFNGAYDPLLYVLMFPFGDLGYHLFIPYYNLSDNAPIPETNMSMKDFYAYRLMVRENEWLHYYGRLFQQYIVDAYAKIESERLLFIRNNQDTLRADCYNGLQDAYNAGETADSVGKRVILPSSFIGSQRYMNNLYQDAMAIVSHCGKPDFFLTFTCNPNWPEIKQELLPNQTTQDRPDLCCRAFNAKEQELFKDLMSIGILGTITALIMMIEFQKRGLPHSHHLISVDNEHKPRSADDYDTLVCAEIPDKDEDPELYETISKCMMHGPCHVNKNLPCIGPDGKCTKGYPKVFVEHTTSSVDGYPIYRRRDNGRKLIVRGIELDNRWVVPYNPYLCKKYNAHINLEICNSVKAVKYLYKYVYKGGDRAALEISEKDEPSRYQIGRYISASEAIYRIYGYKLHAEFPYVQPLDIHLPDKQFITFKATTALETLISTRITTTLTSWLDFNKNAPKEEVSHTLLYREMPQYYTLDHKKQWKRRVHEHSRTIGRTHFVSPREGERYYLRLLLNHCRGCSCFEDLRNYQNIVHQTFKAACFARGLLEDDNEWHLCLAEAASVSVGPQLRELFVTILLFCDPNEPLSLWQAFKSNLNEDYLHRESDKSEIGVAKADNYALCDIDDMLIAQQHKISDYWDTPLPDRWAAEQCRLMREENFVDIAVLQRDVADKIPLLNTDQLHAYNTIMEAVNSSDIQPNSFFLMGAGGSGKTFVENLLLSSVRAQGEVALALASSGIASQLLEQGTTAHSKLKIPLKLTEASTCNIGKNSDLANTLKRAKLIIWDEAPMCHKHAFEAVDRTLCDIMDIIAIMGAKVFVSVGDFKQIPPVVQHGTRSQIVAASLKKSRLWLSMTVLQLNLNMRVLMAVGQTASEHQEFANFLNMIGNGTFPHDSEDNIQLPLDMIQNCNNLTEFINYIYDDLANNANNSDYISKRAIFSTKNSYVDLINNQVTSQFPGECRDYFSADSIVDNGLDTNMFTVEYLNSLVISGLPPHVLQLKVGAPVMMLRNSPSASVKLYNGTRLIVNKLFNHVIEATIFGTQTRVFIPRMSLIPSDVGLPFDLRRRQFPIRTAFAMTINKSQGQTMEKIGLYLPEPVFTHGQLYVALSRVGNRNGIKIFIDKNKTITKNIVYRELLG